MTIGFSISLGDCIAGGKLVKDVAESLGSSRKAEEEIDALILTIKSLEPLLRKAQALRTEQIWEGELEDYMTVATNIENLLAGFVKKIAKFKGTMTVEDSNWAERLGTAFRKLEWTFLKPLVQDFKSDLNTQMSIMNAISSQLYLRRAVNPRNTPADSLISQSFTCPNQHEGQRESASLNSSISPFNCEDPTPLYPDLAAEKKGKIPSFCAYPPMVSHDQANSICLLSRSNGDLSWPNQEFSLDSQLHFDHFSANMLDNPRRKSYRLPIKDPADGSTKIFLQSRGAANQSSPNNGPVPCFTIPGSKNSRVTIKDPLDGSIKLPVNEVKCAKKRATTTETCKASPLFARPSRTKVVVTDPLNMSVLDFVSRTSS